MSFASKPTAGTVTRVAAISLLAAAACSDGSRPAVQAQHGAVVYGDDDRSEGFSAEHPPWLIRAVDERLLALGDEGQLTMFEDAVRVDAPTLGERYDLCEGERFADQPSFALCSAAIITERYVLTAAHCVRAQELETVVGVGRYYYETPGALRPLAPQDVHRFRRVVAQDDYFDYAWLELSERVAGVTAPTMSRVESGDRIVAATHAAGLPAKIVSASALRRDLSFFVSTLDAFGGASGAPVFSAQGDWVGVLSAGAPDYETTPRGCGRVSRRADAPEVGIERALDADVAIAALCGAVDAPELCDSERERREAAGCSVAGATDRGARNPGGWAVVVLGAALGLLRRGRPSREVRSPATVRPRIAIRAVDSSSQCSVGFTHSS